MGNKATKFWAVNVASFILFLVLGMTGLTNWLILPRGWEAKRGLATGVRHFLVEVHEWTALLFMITIAVHVILHWGYVKTNLKRHRQMR
jgi:hypothetical protein